MYNHRHWSVASGQQLDFSLIWIFLPEFKYNINSFMVSVLPNFLARSKEHHP